MIRHKSSNTRSGLVWSNYTMLMKELKIKELERQILFLNWSIQQSKDVNSLETDT